MACLVPLDSIPRESRATSLPKHVEPPSRQGARTRASEARSNSLLQLRCNETDTCTVQGSGKPYNKFIKELERPSSQQACPAPSASSDDTVSGLGIRRLQYAAAITERYPVKALQEFAKFLPFIPFIPPVDSKLV